METELAICWKDLSVRHSIKLSCLEIISKCLAKTLWKMCPSKTTVESLSCQDFALKWLAWTLCLIVLLDNINTSWYKWYIIIWRLQPLTVHNILSVFKNFDIKILDTFHFIVILLHENNTVCNFFYILCQWIALRWCWCYTWLDKNIFIFFY